MLKLILIIAIIQWTVLIMDALVNDKTTRFIETKRDIMLSIIPCGGLIVFIDKVFLQGLPPR